MTSNRWVKRDRRYKSGYRWTSYAYRALFKWTFLLFAWVIVNSIVTVAHRLPGAADDWWADLVRDPPVQGQPPQAGLFTAQAQPSKFSGDCRH